jgi:hypothetical protein
MTDRPHLWVTYPYAPGDAEICTCCGEFQTPENAAGECSDILLDELAPVPLDMPNYFVGPAGWDWLDSTSDGTDDEMRQGAIIPP